MAVVSVGVLVVVLALELVRMLAPLSVLVSAVARILTGPH
jgi:hypothetical protein